MIVVSCVVLLLTIVVVVLWITRFVTKRVHSARSQVFSRTRRDSFSTENSYVSDLYKLLGDRFEFACDSLQNVRKLDSGEFGRVHLAKIIATEEYVAVKQCRNTGGGINTETFEAEVKLKAEAKLMSDLKHPHVILDLLTL